MVPATSEQSQNCGKSKNNDQAVGDVVQDIHPAWWFGIRLSMDLFALSFGVPNGENEQRCAQSFCYPFQSDDTARGYGVD